MTPQFLWGVGWGINIFISLYIARRAMPLVMERKICPKGGLWFPCFMEHSGHSPSNRVPAGSLRDRHFYDVLAALWVGIFWPLSLVIAYVKAAPAKSSSEMERILAEQDAAIKRLTNQLHEETKVPAIESGSKGFGGRVCEPPVQLEYNPHDWNYSVVTGKPIKKAVRNRK